MSDASPGESAPAVHPNAHLYDEPYYRTHCGGIPYHRESAHWREFFGHVADFIVRTFAPKRVLDAGCAHGILVEALRDRGVEAFGFDISTYALSQARGDIRSRIWRASVADPIDGEYDLIVCIEVLEHVDEAEALRAIEMFARHGRALLFSSTPNDFAEPTHVNVRPVEYWLEHFLGAGLMPDPAIDASLVCPQAFAARRGGPATKAVASAMAREINQRIAHLSRERALGAELIQVRARAEESARTVDSLLDQLSKIEAERSAIARQSMGFASDLGETRAQLEAARIEAGAQEAAADELRRECEVRRERAESAAARATLESGRSRSLESRVSSLEAELVRATDEHAKTRRSLEELTARRCSLEATVAQVEEVLQVSRRKIREAESELADARNAVAAAAESAGQAREHSARSDARRQEVEAEAAAHEMNRELMAIKGSRAWRWVQALRRAKASVFQLVSQVVRLLGMPFQLPSRIRDLWLRSGSRQPIDSLPYDSHSPTLDTAKWIRWIGEVRVNDEGHRALLLHPPGSSEYRVSIARASLFRAWVTLQPECWSRNYGGVIFRVEARDVDGQVVASAAHQVQPHVLRHRCWRRIELGLPAAVHTLVLSTSVPPGADSLHAWALWGDPEILTPRTFADALRYTADHLVRRIANPGRFQPAQSGVAASSGDYWAWIRNTEPGPHELRSQREIARQLGSRPLISVILPIYKVPFSVVQETLQCVLDQTYDRWQLCVADASGSAPVEQLLRSVAERDARVSYQRLERNQGISGNSNVALASARGEFVALLDHDDLLSPSALYEVARTLNADPSLDMIYTDKDWISEHGERLFPLFKPEWSPCTLLSANYITHLTVLRTALVRRVGGFRSATDGAQDWDLFLRCSVEEPRVGRISKVLYHWRVIQSSVSSGIKAKPYALRAQIAALDDHLAVRGMQAGVEHSVSGYLRLRWHASTRPRVSVLIRPDHTPDLRRRAAETIARGDWGCDTEIFYADDRPCAEPAVRTLPQGPQSFETDWINLAAAAARGEFLLIVDPDVTPMDNGWMLELARWCTYPGVDVAGVRVFAPDGRLAHAGMVQGMVAPLYEGGLPDSFGVFGSDSWYRELSLVSPCCVMIRRDAFHEATGLASGPALLEAWTELCRRLRAAQRKIVYTPFACVRKASPLPRMPLMPARAAADPFYSPNLSFDAGLPRIIEPGSVVTPPFARPVEAPVHKVQAPPPPDRYSRDAAVLASIHDFSSADLDASRQAVRSAGTNEPLRSVAWLLPEFDHAYYGGVHTILRFGAYLAAKKGVQTRFVVCTSNPVETYRSRAIQALPELAATSWCTMQDRAWLEQHDAGVATLWTTAYTLLRHNRLARKFYFLQDIEPLFYPAGSTSGQVQTTYRFGFLGIANTRGVRDAYVNEYGGRATFFDPAVDLSLFYPADAPATARPLAVDQE